MSSLPKPLGQPWDGSRSILLQESADRTAWIQYLGPDCRTGRTNWAESIKIHSTCPHPLAPSPEGRRGTVRSLARYPPCQLVMKLNSTVSFTFALLFLMLGAGLASAFSGFSIGRDALKGITQPDSRPQKTRAKSANSGAETKDGMVLMKEDDIVKSMKERIASTAKGGGRTDQSEDDKANPDKKPKPADTTPIAKLPLSNNVEGVALEVIASRREGEATLLDLTIKNASPKTVQFRYTFLTVTDDQGRIVPAETIGLPSEIPSNSETFSGSVKLPSNSLKDAKTVTLQMSDYPEQKLQFRLADIPIQ
jgi:hypothetical protein